MSPEPREDALDWGDPSDPSWADPGRDLIASDELREPSDPDEQAEPSRREIRSRQADDAHAHAHAPGARRSAAVTAATGLAGGLYIAYTVGWILSIGTLQLTGATLLIEVLYQFGEFLAIIASALWFGTVMALTRNGTRSAVRLGWLALGALILVPWPLLIAALR
jgi:hypothetical protein